MNNNYSEKLKDPRWQKKRLEILEKHNFQCDWCENLQKELAVHHINYIKNQNPWEYSDDEYMVLCVECHNEWHKDIFIFRTVWSIALTKQRRDIKKSILNIMEYFKE